MTEDSDRLIELAFGTAAGNAEAAARASGRVYVRGLGQLAEDHPKATGRRLTALEALRTYGIEVLAEVGAEGFARLAHTAEVTGRVLKLRREQLGLDQRHVRGSSIVITTGPQAFRPINGAIGSRRMQERRSAWEPRQSFRCELLQRRSLGCR